MDALTALDWRVVAMVTSLVLSRDVNGKSATRGFENVGCLGLGENVPPGVGGPGESLPSF